MRTKDRLIRLKQLLSLQPKTDTDQALQEELENIDDTSAVIRKRLDDMEYVLGDYSPYQAMLDVIRHDLRRIERSSNHIKTLHHIPETERPDPQLVRRVKRIIEPNN